MKLAVWFIIVFLITLNIELTLKYFNNSKYKLSKILPIKIKIKKGNKNIEYITYIINAFIVSVTSVIVMFVPYPLIVSLPLSFLILLLLIFVSYEILNLIINKPKKEKIEKEKKDNKNKKNFYHTIFFSIFFLLLLILKFNIVCLLFLILNIICAIIFWMRMN